MPDVATVKFNKGLVTSRNPATLQNGELQTATGVMMHPGDPDQLHKVNGRSVFGDTGTAAIVKGLALCKFDNGADKVIALSGTALYSAAAGTTGTFAALTGATGLSASANRLSAAHANDRWYLCNGTDYNRVLESDGTVRRHGMLPPDTAPTVTGSFLSGTFEYPTETTNSGFTNPTYAYDQGITFAHATLTAPGTATCIFKTWASSTGTTRKLLCTVGKIYSFSSDSSSPCDTTLNVYYSLDSGSTWVSMGTVVTNTSTKTFSVSLDGARDVNSDLIQLKVEFIYASGSVQITARIYDVYISRGGSQSAFDITTGIYYAVAEYDSARGLESTAAVSSLVTWTGKNYATIVLPPAAKNPTATHWNIYRTTDGNTQPFGLFLVESLPISSTFYCDGFILDKDTEGSTYLEQLSITFSNATEYYQINNQPPGLSQIGYFKGHLWGLSNDLSRSLYYTPEGRPESWPSIYVNDKFPLEEHDRLVTGISLGEVLLIGAEEAIFRLTDLPTVENGVFSGGEVTVLKGQPGVVGKRGMCAFSLSGEPNAAWVSPYGIHQTNGTISRLLTTDLDWTATVDQGTLSTCVLRWDPLYHQLIFSYDSDGGGANDRILYLHMGQEHTKDDGLPLITSNYGVVNDLAIGTVGGIRRIFSAHTTDGKVYLEDYGTTDASGAYSSTTIPVDVKTARIYQGFSTFGIIKGNLRHTDWGTGKTCTLTATTGRASSGVQQAVAKTVTLNGTDGSDFLVGRAGDWAEFRIQQDAAATGALLDMRVVTQKFSLSGKVTS